MTRCCSIFFLVSILVLSTGLVFAAEAELTNLVIRNSREDLLISLKIKGVFTREMQDALTKGISVSLKRTGTP